MNTYNEVVVFVPNFDPRDYKNTKSYVKHFKPSQMTITVMVRFTSEIFPHTVFIIFASGNYAYI
jgi:hypothetical protein